MVDTSTGGPSTELTPQVVPYTRPTPCTQPLSAPLDFGVRLRLLIDGNETVISFQIRVCSWPNTAF